MAEAGVNSLLEDAATRARRGARAASHGPDKSGSRAEAAQAEHYHAEQGSRHHAYEGVADDETAYGSGSAEVHDIEDEHPDKPQQETAQKPDDLR